MTITDIIKQLEMILEEHGDLEVCTFDEEDEVFKIGLDKEFLMIEMADEEDGEVITKLAALMDPYVIDEKEPEPDKPKLTVVK